MQRNNSSDKLNANSKSGASQNISPEKMGDIAGIENEFETYGGNRGGDVVVQDINSMPGSFAEASGANEIDVMNPDINADDEYRSQKSNDEIEVQVQLVEEQGKGEKTDATKDTTKNINLRRDPEEEFFMLAILALKMQHTENHEAEFIYQIDSIKLYEQVKQIKIPFHKWYQWLETKFCLLKVAYEQE